VSRIPDRVRQLVVEWPADAPRGAIDEFCRSHGVSKSWFHAVRAKAVAVGDAALVKGSTRPRRSPAAVSDAVVAVVIATRADLVETGKDHGSLSILDVLDRAGFVPLPSRSTIARILDREHLVQRNRRKRPKRSHRRIRSEFPNQRWQSDGLEVTLSTGEVVVVIEIIDDCTRFNIGLHPGPAETARVVVDTFRRAIQTYGRPVLVHTDNGTAFNMARLGKVTALQTFLGDLGVKMITGSPSHPKSQGKVERAHQTLLNFIAAQAPATIDELERVLGEYRDWYNHHRSHQSLPPRTAPADLYETMSKIAPPGDPINPHPVPPVGVARSEAKEEPIGEVVQYRTAYRGGGFGYSRHKFLLGKAWAGQRVTIVRHDDQIEIFDSQGTRIAVAPWPPSKPMTSLARQIDTPPPR